MPCDYSWIATEDLFTEPFLLALPTAHPLAKKTVVETKDIETDSLLLLDDGHCLREQSLDVCRRIGVGESQHFRATSLPTLLQMVATGAGVTFVPQLACSDFNPGVCYRPLTDPTPSRDIALCWRKSSSRTVLMHALAAEIRTSAQVRLRKCNL